MRTRQEARLLDHISEQIVTKYIDRKQKPLFVKATRDASTQTARPVQKHQVSQTVTPPLPRHSFQRAPPADRRACAVATAVDEPWEDVDQTGNTRRFWFHPDRRLGTSKSPKPPLLRGDPRRQRTPQYETDISRQEAKSYSVKDVTAPRFGEPEARWFHDGQPALHAAKSGYWRPGCIIPHSDGSTEWDHRRNRSPNYEVQFYFTRCGTTHRVKFEHCSVFCVSRCDEPHGHAC